ADRAVEVARDGGGTVRVAIEVDGRGRVGVDREGGGDVLLGGEQAGQVGVDLADLAVGAGSVHAVAVRRAGGAAHEVVALVRGHDEQGVILVDAVGLQAGEEGGEGRVVGAEGGHVVGLA